jgi:hypothetical protein
MRRKSPHFQAVFLRGKLKRPQTFLFLGFNSDIRGEIYERWHGRELGWEGKKKVV